MKPPGKPGIALDFSPQLAKRTPVAPTWNPAKWKYGPKPAVSTPKPAKRTPAAPSSTTLALARVPGSSRGPEAPQGPRAQAGRRQAAQMQPWHVRWCALAGGVCLLDLDLRAKSDPKI